MLEVLYNTNTLEVRAWCADETQFGNLIPGTDEAVIIFPIAPPLYDSAYFYVDLSTQQVFGDPLPEPTPTPIFTPVNPVHGVEQRLTYVESFLTELFG